MKTKPTGRKARADRRPVVAGVIWDIITANEKAVVDFLGEIGLAPAEARKQYLLWRGQLWHGLKEQATWARELDPRRPLPRRFFAARRANL